MDLVEDLMPLAERLDCVDDLREVLRILQQGASYERQRVLLATGATLEDIVAVRNCVKRSREARRSE